ncbi:hypothetical protein ACWGHD_19105 [Streptomyces xanthophaeus]
MALYRDRAGAIWATSSDDEEVMHCLFEPDENGDVVSVGNGFSADEVADAYGPLTEITLTMWGSAV